MDEDEFEYDESLDEIIYEIWALVYTEDDEEISKEQMFLGAFEDLETAITTAQEITVLSDLVDDEELAEIIEAAGPGGRIELRVEENKPEADFLDEDTPVLYSQNFYY